MSAESFVLHTTNKERVSFSFYGLIYSFKIILFPIQCWFIDFFSFKEKNKILKIIIKFLKLYLLFCCLEFIFKNIFQSELLYEIQQFFFGIVSATQSEIRYRGLLASLQGLTKEPSYFVAQLMIVGLFFVADEKINSSNNKKWYGLIFLLSLISMSFSSILFIFNFIFLLLYAKNNLKIALKKMFLIVMVCSIFSLTGLIYFMGLDTYLSRLTIVLNILPLIINGYYFETHDISIASRLYTIIDSINIFLDRILLGIGFGNVNCMAVVWEFLASCGLLIFVFYLFSGPFSLKNFNKDTYTAYFICLIPYLFTGGENPFITLQGLMTVFAIGLIFNSEVRNNAKLNIDYNSRL